MEWAACTRISSRNASWLWRPMTDSANPGIERQLHTRLFLPQRGHRRHERCAPGRQCTGTQTNEGDGCHRGRVEKCVSLAQAEQQMAHEARAPHGSETADNGAREDERHAFADD